ncbi:MAG: hypothetical protein KC621_21510 [Myxococcales bacterium]|nr:hypothetical protein [Myxococcales bacterium]
MRSLVPAVFLGALLASCDDHQIGQAPVVGTSCLREPPLTYENFGSDLLNRHCNSCHSVYSREGQRGQAPLDVNFDTWDEVLFWADRISARSVETETMPPAGGMVPDERVLLGEWLRCEVYPALGQVGGGPGTTQTEGGGT